MIRVEVGLHALIIHPYATSINNPDHPPAPLISLIKSRFCTVVMHALIAREVYDVSSNSSCNSHLVYSFKRLFTRHL